MIREDRHERAKGRRKTSLCAAKCTLDKRHFSSKSRRDDLSPAPAFMQGYGLEFEPWLCLRAMQIASERCGGGWRRSSGARLAPLEAVPQAPCRPFKRPPPRPRRKAGGALVKSSLASPRSSPKRHQPGDRHVAWESAPTAMRVDPATAKTRVAAAAAGRSSLRTRKTSVTSQMPRPPRRETRSSCLALDCRRPTTW